MKNLLKCEAIRDFNVYSLEELKKLKSALVKEYKSYFTDESSQKLNKVLSIYNINAISLSNRYDRILDIMTYKINSKLGAYNLYDVENSANKSIRRTIENYFAMAQRYGVPANLELTISDSKQHKDYYFHNTTNIIVIQDILNLIKIECEQHRDRKYLEIEVIAYLHIGNNVCSYYKRFRKASRKNDTY